MAGGAGAAADLTENGISARLRDWGCLGPTVFRVRGPHLKATRRDVHPGRGLGTVTIVQTTRSERVIKGGLVASTA